MDKVMEKFEFKSTDKGCMLKSYTGDDSVVIVPQKHDGKDVIGICEGAFLFSENKIEKIVLHSKIKEIDGGSFFGCGYAKEIVVDSDNPWFMAENGVLFTKDRSMLVYFPSGIEEVDENFFNSKYAVSAHSFAACKLSEVILGEEIVDVEIGAFARSEKLVHCKLPSHLETIAPYTFESCSSLEYVKGRGVKTIKESAFIYCGKLKVCENKRLRKIEETAFKGCRSLEVFTLSDSLYEVAMDDWLKTSAFADCENLREINVEERNYFYKSVDGVLFNADGTILIYYPNGKKDECYKIPDGVEKISYGAFKNAKYLKKVIIADSVKEIWDEAFENCIGMVDVEMSKNIEEISEYAFRNCVNLQRLVLPKSLQRITRFTFANCENLHLYCKFHEGKFTCLTEGPYRIKAYTWHYEGE